MFADGLWAIKITKSDLSSFGNLDAGQEPGQTRNG